MVFDFLRKKDKDKEFKENFLLTEESKPDQEDDYNTVMLKQGPFLYDEFLTKIIMHYPFLYGHLAANSQVNRTTKHISKSDAHVAWIDYQILQLLTDMDMTTKNFEEVGLAFQHGLEMFHNTVISDGWEGWKGRILTEQTKKHYIETKK